MSKLVWTYKSAVAGGRRVHALMGGGPGTVDEQGRPRYLAGRIWCGVERYSRVHLVETDAPVTCKACLRALERWARRMQG